jgi:site-specific DNA-methyltransferase (adenine-specific)
MTIKLLQGDCLELLGKMKDNSVNAFITDLPYGTTQNKWDSVINLEKMWLEVNRVGKENFVFITTAPQPFTSVMVMSNLKQFKHEWIWLKSSGGNFANTVREPMKEHESVLVFSPGKWTYNKQMQERSESVKGMIGKTNYRGGKDKSDNYGDFQNVKTQVKLSELRVPSSWQRFKSVRRGTHPTQKPVELYEYLVKTYTNEADLVVDPCMGSGTTGVACKNLKRNFIGFEKDLSYFEKAKSRLEESV